MSGARTSTGTRGSEFVGHVQHRAGIVWRERERGAIEVAAAKMDMLCSYDLVSTCVAVERTKCAV